MRSNKERQIAHKLALIASILTIVVMGLGAFTRLIDAGLGCPDWPGCYGHLLVPSKTTVMTHLVTYKAWSEMIHRYFAGTLATLLLIIGCLGSRIAYKNQNKLILIPSIALLLLLLYQPILGMWTVTLKLMPAIVSQHLLGGMLIFSFLWWYRLILSNNQAQTLQLSTKFTTLFRIGLVLILCQIALGAWTSTNYAALSCQDFPYCQANQWFPHWQFGTAYNIFNKIGLNYDGGLLPLAAKQTIQMVHRIGAFCVVGYWFVLGAVTISKQENPATLKPLFILLGLLALQIALGIGNVLLALPVALAVCHNLCAGFSLVTAISLNYRLKDKVYESEHIAHYAHQ